MGSVTSEKSRDHVTTLPGIGHWVGSMVVRVFSWSPQQHEETTLSDTSCRQRGSILNSNHRVMQDPEQAESTRRPALWLHWKQEFFHWNTSQLRDPTDPSYIAKCCPSWTPCTKPGFQNRKGWGGARARRWLEKARANARGNQKHQEKKKLEKPKKVQGKLFCVSLFLAKCEKNQHKRERQSQ